MKQSRNSYFDFLRGVAIIMVVGIHTFRYEDVNMLSSIDFSVLIRQVMNCAVPIFLAISGYFLCTKKLDTWDDRKKFWKKQMPKVYVPAIIVSLPYFFINLIHGSNVVKSMIVMLICGYSIYYFIALILQYYALLPILQRINQGGVIVSSIISLASVFCISVVTNVCGLHLPLIIYAGPFPVWLVFFVLGCWLRKNNRSYSILMPLIICLIGIIMMYGEAYFWNTNYGGGIGIKFSSVVFSIGVILFLFSKKTEQAYSYNKFTHLFEYIGSISFAIYLYHLYSYEFLKRIHVITTSVSWLLSSILCLMITIIAIETLKRILPDKVHKYFGL